MRPRRHFNLHLDLLLSPVVARRRQVVETRHTTRRRLPPNGLGDDGPQILKSEPLPCAGFRPSDLGVACLCRGRHWPDHSQLCGSDFGTTAGRSLKCHADEDGPATPTPTGSQSGSKGGCVELVRLALLESFPGSDFAPVTSLCGYDTNTNEDIDSRHGSLSRWWQPGDGVCRRAAQADCSCSSPSFSVQSAQTLPVRCYQPPDQCSPPLSLVQAIGYGTV